MSEPTTTQSVQPLEGKTSIDQQMFFEPELLSYQAAEDVAKAIVDQIKGKVDSQTVVLADDALLADLANLEAIYIHLDGVLKDYISIADSAQKLFKARSGVTPEARELAASDEVMAALPLAPITAGISAALSLLSLFREDTEYQGRKTTIEGTSFQLMIAGELKRTKAKAVFLPRLMMRGEEASPPEDSSLPARLDAVHDAKERAWVTIRPLVIDLANLDAALDLAARAGDQAEVDRLSQELGALRRDLDPITNPLSQLNSRLNDLEAQWLRIDEKSGLAPLARLLRAETVRRFAPLYLYTSVISAGGSYRIRRNLLRTLFSGDGLSFSGGAVAMFALLDSDGSISAAGVKHVLLPFRRFKEISQSI